MAEELHFEFGNGTDTGCVRKQNEDAFMLFIASDRKQRIQKGHLALICDGMGGARGGQTASSMAVEEIARIYYGSNANDVRTAITQAIKSANTKIYHRSISEPALKGMGTTVVAAMILEDSAYIAHVGDSRCYLIRNKEISQITEDHTIVQKMVRQGLIDDEEARNHPEGHVLSRSVGVGADVEIDLTMEPIELETGDTLLICSDGLSGQVNEDELMQIASSGTAQHAVERLIALAKERGGPDNITAQIVRVNSHEREDSVETSTIRTAPLSRSLAKPITLTALGLVAIAVILGALWYFKIFDFSTIPGFDGLPDPPQ